MKQNSALNAWSEYLASLRDAIETNTLKDDEVFGELAVRLFSLQCQEGTLLAA